MVTTEVESRVLQTGIKRSAVAKVFAICLLVINWSLTIGSVYITLLVAYKKLGTNSMVTAVPFSFLLTVPAIRSLYFSPAPLGLSVGKSCMSQFPPFHFVI